MILADASGLLAVFDPRDAAHADCAAFLRNLRRTDQLMIPSVVIGELGYFLERRLGPVLESAVLRRLARASWGMEPVVAADLLRAADLVEQYGDFSIGTVDALIVAMAERLKVTTLFTLDRRHFSAIQPAHCERFEIVP